MIRLLQISLTGLVITGLVAAKGKLEPNDQGETIRDPRSAAAIKGVGQKPQNTDQQFSISYRKWESFTKTRFLVILQKILISYWVLLGFPISPRWTQRINPGPSWSNCVDQQPRPLRVPETQRSWRDCTRVLPMRRDPRNDPCLLARRWSTAHRLPLQWRSMCWSANKPATWNQSRRNGRTWLWLSQRVDTSATPHSPSRPSRATTSRIT